MIQDVAYNSLLMQRRKALHQAVGEAIEELYQDRLEEHYAELAYHFSQGEVWEKAFNYCRQAGEKAMGQSAHREAVGYFEQALNALRHLPETRTTREQAIDLRFDLRTALYPLGALERIIVYLQEATVLAETLGDQHRLGWTSTYMTVDLWLMGDKDRAIEPSQHALAIATTLGTSASTLRRTTIKVWSTLLGDYARAIEALTWNVIALHWCIPPRALRPTRFSRGALSAWLSWSLAERGAFPEGMAQGEEALRLAEAVDHTYSHLIASFGVGLLYLRKGDLSKATAVLERGLELCQVAHLQSDSHSLLCP